MIGIADNGLDGGFCWSVLNGGRVIWKNVCGQGQASKMAKKQKAHARSLCKIATTFEQYECKSLSNQEKCRKLLDRHVEEKQSHKAGSFSLDKG